MTNILNSLNIKKEEFSLYLFFLTNPEQTASFATKSLKMPRATVYGYIDNLKKNGLLLEKPNSKIRKYISEGVAKIDVLIQEKIDQLEFDKINIQSYIASLDLHIITKKPKFEIYENGESLQNILRDMLMYSNIETIAFWPIKSMMENLSPDFFKFHNRMRIKNNIYTRAIWPLNQIVDTEKYPFMDSGQTHLREVRIAPKNINFKMGYWVYGNKVAFVSSIEENYGFIIESRELVEVLKSQFEVVWSKSKSFRE